MYEQVSTPSDSQRGSASASGHGAAREPVPRPSRGMDSTLTLSALRDDCHEDEDVGASTLDMELDAQRNQIPMMPLLGGGAKPAGARRSSLGGGAASERRGSQYSLTPSQSRGALRRRPASKKRSFYHRSAELRGRVPRVPRHWLRARFRHNSFFARRLVSTGMPLAVVLAAGLGFYYFFQPDWLLLNPVRSPNEFGFLLRSPRAVYSFQGTSCENVVGFSALIYHCLPAVLLLLLPGSGWRAFEPFTREEAVGPDAKKPSKASDKAEAARDLEANGNAEANEAAEDEDEALGSLAKIRRTFLFQLCELVAVVLLVFMAVVVLFFLYMFFNGGAFSCGIHAVQLFALVSMGCFVALFTELRYFARFREHVKMLLGAFQESDQTGDVRNHVMDPGRDQLLTQNEKVLAVVRKRLYKAARQGDVRELRDVLDYAQAKGLCSDEVGFPRRSYAPAALVLGFFAQSRKNPVHVAASHGNVRALELLEARGFDVTALDKFSRVRFSTGDLFWSFARFFVARPGAAGGGGSEEDTAASIFRTTLVTPLHCAVSTGQLEAVRWLLARGASARALARSSSRADRVPPLFLAEHPEVVRELLLHGADPLCIPDPGHANTLTALQLAYLRGNYAVAQELEEWGGDVALTPFHSAAGRNDVLSVRKFLRRKTDVDCLGEMGYVGLNRRTPLHWAAVSGSLEVVDLLLEAGADPNFQDAGGRSPLHWAARLNKLEVVRALLRSGADPKLADLEFLTPLVCAAYGQDAPRELFSALTTAGADINYQLPTTGDTALHAAVRQEHEGSALAILACGGDLMRMNVEGLRPLDCTTSTRLLFEIKRAAGQRDVMISYTHSHAEFAKKLRKSLEAANVTTWLDLMDPSGIGGGAVWREEIARGITHASLVLCILTEDYAASEWCLKELALAKQVGTPILAVSTESVRIGEDLQVYLYTRQLIPFEPAIVRTRRNAANARQIEYDYEEEKYQAQFRLLLDGVRDEVEKNRDATQRKNVALSSRRNANLQNSTSGGTMLAATSGFSRLFRPWELDDQSRQRQFVFLSHGDKHAGFVQQLLRELSDAGVLCYLDRSVDGQAFEGRIQAAQEAILRCTCFVVLLSKQTMGNELIRDQLALAEDKGRPIFPVVLNDLEPGLDKRYSLARNELFHFMANGMSFKPSADRLLNGLRRHYTDEPDADADADADAADDRDDGSSGVDNGTRIADANTSFVSFTFSEPGGKGRGSEAAAAPVILEGAELRGSSSDGPSASDSANEDGSTVTRNFESISGLDDAHLDLSSTHVRM